MGNETNAILLGGAVIYNVEKTEVEEDKKGNPIYCVWLEGGAYAEYPEQKTRDISSYYAKDKISGITHPITEKTFKSNKTQKDGNEYTFIEEVADYPSISSEKVTELEGKGFYEHLIDGFDGIKFVGTENPDGVYLTNTSNAEVVTDNDTEKDGVNIMVNCKNIKYHIEQGLDVICRWVGYDKKNGYFADFKNK